MSNLAVFSNEYFGNVRITMIDGNPWFVARDVCDCLEIGNPYTSLALLDVDEKTTLHSMETLNDSTGLRKDSCIINESGLYSLILRSRKLNGVNTVAIKRSLLNNDIMYRMGDRYKVYSKYRDTYFEEKYDAYRVSPRLSYWTRESSS